MVHGFFCEYSKIHFYEWIFYFVNESQIDKNAAIMICHYRPFKGTLLKLIATDMNL